MPSPKPSDLSSLAQSQLTRLALLGLLALALKIPIALIDELVEERTMRRGEAVDEITGKWGREQTVLGPALVVPYVHEEPDVGLSSSSQVRRETREAFFLPESLELRSAIDSEERTRGIFSVPVYRMTVDIEGGFGSLDLAALGLAAEDFDWTRARLVLGVFERTIQQDPILDWDGQQIAFLPDARPLADGGVHAPIVLDPAAEGHRFSTRVVLNGSLASWFTPFGRRTVVEVTSNHPHPSFQGDWLPGERSVEADGFRARWSIPFLGRNFPQVFTSKTVPRDAIREARFGVALHAGIDQYRMADRSVKYAFLFVLLTFTVLWLIEVLARLRVHPIQYLLIGAALCLFYLLELSLSEHTGFALAYTIASLSTAGLVSFYAASVLHRTGLAAIVGGSIALLYLYLYALLTNGDYALLFGSIGLFVALGLVMFSTRHVDWYEARAPWRTPDAPDPVE